MNMTQCLDVVFWNARHSIIALSGSRHLEGRCQLHLHEFEMKATHSFKMSGMQHNVTSQIAGMPSYTAVKTLKLTTAY